MFGDLKVERLKVWKSLISSFTEQVSHKFDLSIECRYQCPIGILLFGGHYIFNHGDMHYLCISTISFRIPMSPFARFSPFLLPFIFTLRVQSMQMYTCIISEYRLFQVSRAEWTKLPRDLFFTNVVHERYTKATRENIRRGRNEHRPDLSICRVDPRILWSYSDLLVSEV